MSEVETSGLQGNLPLADKLDRARTELLDLSARNRLLNVPRFSKSAKTIDVVDEKTAEVYRLLVQEQKSFTFQAGKPDRPKGEGADKDSQDGLPQEEDDYLPVALAQPLDDETDERGVARRHADTKLMTRMTPTGLQKRLLDLYHDARTLEEEQGVNILFLAMGMMKWVDPNNKENVRHAPLVLVPVRLERGTAGEKFRLRARPEDQTANLSLELYLERVHSLALPAFAGGEDFDPVAYIEAVRDAVSSKEGWEVLADDIVLGFFSFAKFLMYRDLDPDNWPAGSKITEQKTIRSLLADGFESGEPLLSDDVGIDLHIAPADMLHIVDSDSSQTLAVHDVRRGRDLVIQGPPGTGKSQTIANVIASAVADGKTVLFVAEKMAALEVVKRRLDHAGVGDACLELHSNKANKRMLLQELQRTWHLGSPRGQFPSGLGQRLLDARDTLNGHATRMHVAHQPSELTPYQLFGELTRLLQAGQRPVDLKLHGAQEWSPEGLATRRNLLKEVAERIDEIGLPIAHPWRGVGLDMVLPTTLERLIPGLQSLKVRIESLRSTLAALAQSLELDAPVAPADTRRTQVLADKLAAAPDLEPGALASEVWNESLNEIAVLLARGADFASRAEALKGSLASGALDVPIEGLEAELAWLPESVPLELFERARALAALLPRLTEEARRLERELGVAAPADTLAAITRLATTGERVASAPDASPEAFAATVWDSGLEQAGDLADSVGALEAARASVGDRLKESAWDTDVASARQALATHTGFLKVLSGDFRRARTLLRSIASDPSLPQAQAVDLFDALMKGQAARRKVLEGEAFGRSAFGADWRGEKSASAPLQALVEWMRTLRGLGAEPRQIAGRLADRSEAGARAERVRKLLDEAKPLLNALWDDLGHTASTAFEDVASAERARVDLVEKRSQSLAWADDLTKRIHRDVPERLADRLALVRRLMDSQAQAKALDGSEELGRSAFGSAWEGRMSDWQALAEATRWISEHRDLRHLASRMPGRKAVALRAHEASSDAEKAVARLGETAGALKATPASLFGVETFDAVPFDDMLTRLESWVENSEQLSKWVAYRERADKARDSGMTELIDALATGQLATGSARPALDMAYYETILADLATAQPELIRFDGELHGRAVRDFANLDRERIKAAAIEVVTAHHRKIPSRDGGAGPVGTLRGEMARKRNHMPIRQLMQVAGPAIQAIKPVMMMSPLSVAQFLSPGRMSFDLLVMDEASQIQPVDALGAIARAKQVVVVGDEKQLPPTAFFARMTGNTEGEDDEGEGAQVADIESILGLFTARGLPQRMLRWHYRSRHQSLIAVSNSQFYENKLNIVPSPYTQEAGMGLCFHHVPDGVFDSGGTRINAVEARTVAEAIIRHAKTNPGESLGVATFSVNQRRAIQDELEALRRLNPDTEDFFHAHPSEPFFVKNLENVQGDERDVIMISVGYAKNAQGYMAMRFGPLGSEGGERRLNVLISRAKRRCEVFASITDEDIDTERSKGKGVFAFKLFLHYARTGKMSLARTTDRPMDSVFEEQVANALMERGYQVHAQVGIAGFFIDLAIADPERPGRYILGIECDGAAYHSSRSARDRDRLRQAVLEDHGWIIHRIWSTDWFHRPKEQLERAVAAIEAGKKELDDRMEHGLARQRAVPVEVVTVDRGGVAEPGLFDAMDAKSGARYVEATLERPGPYELHETPVGRMADLVAQVVQVEGPVHVDEVTARIRDAFGLSRIGGRIQAAVQHGIERAVQHRGIVQKGEFLSMPGSPLVVRDRRNASSAGLRRPEALPPSEVEGAVLQVVTENLGASRNEILTAVPRMLGLRGTSTQARDVVEKALDALVSGQRITERDSVLVAVMQAADANASADGRVDA